MRKDSHSLLFYGSPNSDPIIRLLHTPMTLSKLSHPSNCAMSAQDGPSLPSVWPCSDPEVKDYHTPEDRVPSASTTVGQVAMGLAVSRRRSAAHT